MSLAIVFSQFCEHPVGHFLLDQLHLGRPFGGILNEPRDLLLETTRNTSHDVNGQVLSLEDF